jgi:hypothetical protein
MPDYRAYFVGPEKLFIGYRGFVCRDDGEAIEQANGLFEGPTIELWCARASSSVSVTSRSMAASVCSFHIGVLRGRRTAPAG